jgi:hypothetical protein
MVTIPRNVVGVERGLLENFRRHCIYIQGSIRISGKFLVLGDVRGVTIIKLLNSGSFIHSCNVSVALL